MHRSFTRLLCALALSVITHAAWAEIVVIVSAESSLRTITRVELEDIYLGRLHRLSDRARVVPVDQAETTEAYEEFYRRYLGRTPAQIKAHWSKLIFTGRGQPPQSVKEGSAVLERVADDPDAISYVDAALVNDQVRVLEIE